MHSNREQINSSDHCAILHQVKVTEKPCVRGRVTTTQIITKNGEVLSTRLISRYNLVVDNGRDNLARLLGGDSSLSIAYLVLGDAKDNAPVLNDSLLENEVKRITYDQGTDKSYPSTGSVLFSRTVLGNDFASTTVIREGALFLSDGSAAVDTGTIFNRVIFVDDDPGIGLTNAGLIFQPTNAQGVAINNKIEFEILF